MTNPRGGTAPAIKAPSRSEAQPVDGSQSSAPGVTWRPTRLVTTAPCDGRCVRCGRSVQAGEPHMQGTDGAVHAACASLASGFMRRRRKQPCTDTPQPGVGDGAAPQPAPAHCCPDHAQLCDRLPLAAQECRFEVRFPGWTSDLAAHTPQDAAWAAEKVALDHAPSTPVEVRCANSERCGHPAEWVQIGTVM